MKKLFSKTMIFLGALSLIMGTVTAFGVKPSYAANLEVIGSEIGLEVNPSGTNLFNLTNLNPGDTHEAKIDIKNNYTSPFEVFMRTERISPQPEPGEADLFEQLILTIYLDNVEIYSGPMKDYATSNISLGDLNENSEKELRAVVHLPGPETGNEFQGKSVEVKWIFIAEIEPGEPTEPEEPGEPGEPNEPGEPSGGGGSTVIITPIEPDEPEEPEEEEEIDEEVPEAEPEEPEEEEEIDEEIPQDKPDEPEEPGEPEENINEEIPKDKPIMPRTGEIPATIYYALGSMLVGLGLGFRKKDEK